MYLDGAAGTPASITTADTFTDVKERYFFLMGGEYDITDGADTYWEGKIYELRLYGVTLFEYDIYLIYDSCRLPTLWDTG